MANAYSHLKHVRHIFAWGADDEATLENWLNADPRFEVFTKLGRVLLFPKGERPAASAEERAKTIFRWCRKAAEHGRTHYLFDYRIFGGREWDGHWNDLPVTRVSEKVPASLMLIGEAMKNPYMNPSEQKQLLQHLRETADWDLDDPEYFYKGKSRSD